MRYLKINFSSLKQLIKKMKKLLILALSLMTGLSAFAGPQGEDNGLGLKFFAGFHSWKYGSLDLGIGDAFVDDDEMPNASPCVGLAMDNRWYVANPGNVGIAINARWFDFSYASLKESEEKVEYKTKYFDASALGIGVIGTYYFSDDMAVDAFWNITPNVLIINNSVETPLADESASDFAFGASQRLGAAYRYKVFQAGFELKFGKLKYQDWGSDDEADDEFSQMAYDMVGSILGDAKYKTTNFRVFIGFKF